MTLSTVLGLIALALVDSTSIGTLIIPLWLLIRPGWRPRLILVYLASITGFYLLVGLLLMAGALTVLPTLSAVLERPAFGWIQLGLGGALLALSFWIDPRAVRRRAVRAGRQPPAVPRWQQKINNAAATPFGMFILALGAGLVEVAGMLPYLAAIAIITSFGLSPFSSALLLAGYTLLMALPALGLVFTRVAAGHRVNDRLDRFGGWLARHTGGSISWVVAIIGILLAWDAVERLHMLGALPWSA